MRSITRNEFTTWLQYFSIAFIAELIAAFGWLQHRYGNDDNVIFNVFAMLLEHERQRLPVWLLVFLMLSIGRLLIRRFWRSFWPEWLGDKDKQAKENQA